MSATGREARRAPSDAPRAVVLVVDDEAPIADVVAEVVGLAGHEAVVAAHGRQALELARERRPALVITDLMMPVLDGPDLIGALRAAAADGHAAPPIVVMTAAGSGRADEAGADAVLRKPFELAELDALLRRFLGPPPADQ